MTTSPAGQEARQARRPLRVVVADDHLLVREGVVGLLHAGDDVTVVASVARADDLLAAVDEYLPDAVLTDIRMPPGEGLDGIAAARELRRRHADAGVVVLSQHLETEYVTDLFRDGTAGLGYLLKDRIGHREHLVQALHESAAGGSVIDPRVVEVLVRQDRSRLRDLAGREAEVLALMAEGCSNPAIAGRLHLSLSSVEKHVNAIFTKLGLSPERETHRRVMAVLSYLRDGTT